MTFSWFRGAASAAFLLGVPCQASAQQADFNEVGRQMSIMLQNIHFVRLPYNAELSRRFVDDYLKELDPQRLYFTRADVDGFNERHGDSLHRKLLDGSSMPVATEIYRVFVKRVEERVALAEKLLKEEFDFSGQESVMLSRKDAPWPKNDKEASDVWALQIKEAVLGEMMRRELREMVAKEQGKAESLSGGRSPAEKVSVRYQRYLNSVKGAGDEEIANHFLSAVAHSYDPHTDYMSVRETKRFSDDMKNQSVGIGALLEEEEDGAVKVAGIVAGGPADRGGVLKPDDRVVGVNRMNTGKAEDVTDIKFMALDQVLDLVRGAEGTSVGLKVEPAGGPPGEAKFIVVQRGKVEMKDRQASGEVIHLTPDQGAPYRLGVITLPSFYADFEKWQVRCSVDVERILKRLTEEKIDGLILDLRGNGGGSLDEVCRMTGFFLGQAPVVQVKGTQGQVQVKESEGGKALYTGPMTVMVDRYSASASEILAGALQDFNRAVIIGDSSTFGKGTVQQQRDIGRMLPLFAPRRDVGMLKLTHQKFYRPSGSSTQLEGVVPQIVVPNLADALETGEAFLDHYLPHDRIRPAMGFRPLDVQNLFLPRLLELSQERVGASKDHGYISEDLLKAKTRLKENRVSLNLAEREKELRESRALQQGRNAERTERFAKMVEDDRKHLSFYKVTLDDLAKGADLKEYDPGVENDPYMKRAKVENPADGPRWPSGLDPMKREAICVTRDLVSLAENAKLAGMLKESR